MARRMRGGSFGWGVPGAGTGFGQEQTAGGAEVQQPARKASGKGRFGGSGDVQDAVVKEIRS